MEGSPPNQPPGPGGPPSGGYQPPPDTSPPGGYTPPSPPPGYQQPPQGYQQAPQGYQQAPPGYGPPPGQPAYGYPGGPPSPTKRSPVVPIVIVAVIVVAVAAALFFLLTKKSGPAAGGGSPEGAIQKLFNDAKAKNCAAVQSDIDSKSIEELRKLGGLEALCQSFESDPTDSAESISFGQTTNVDATHAKTKVTTKRKSGQTNEDEIGTVKESGVWKVDLSALLPSS